MASNFDDLYREQVNTGFWTIRDTIEGGMMEWQLDLDGFVSDVLLRMRTIEEKITRDLVVARLREMGYTVIEPKEGS